MLFFYEISVNVVTGFSWFSYIVMCVILCWVKFWRAMGSYEQPWLQLDRTQLQVDIFRVLQLVQGVWDMWENGRVYIRRYVLILANGKISTQNWEYHLQTGDIIYINNICKMPMKPYWALWDFIGSNMVEN